MVYSGGGIKHKSVGNILTREEFEAIDSHFIRSGTSFPDNPGEGDLFYRTDLNALYIYNGASWLVLIQGSTSSADNVVARWNGTGGIILQDSKISIDDAGSITIPSGQTVDGVDISDISLSNQPAAPTGDIDCNTKPIINSASTERHIRIPASNLGRNPTHPPIIDVYGICHVAEFTVDTDLAYYKINVPKDLVGTTANIHFHWTRSKTGSDDSSKTVRWQVRYISVADGENVNAGEATGSVQDAYDDADTSNQIVYLSGSIELTGLAIDDSLIMEIKAITPTGIPLSTPALLEFCITYTAHQVIPVV